MVDDCIFCKIIAGDIPSSKVYEDEGSPRIFGHLSGYTRSYVSGSKKNTLATS